MITGIEYFEHWYRYFSTCITHAYLWLTVIPEFQNSTWNPRIPHGVPEFNTEFQVYFLGERLTMYFKALSVDDRWIYIKACEI